MTRLRRRDFLKVLGLGGTTAAMGCSPEAGRKLIPYVVPPDDIIPGQATWYATTCRECPAGCGLLAKNREGRVIKVEGNPRHPLNQGALCARGQASLHGLYNPDRLKGPLIRNARGVLESAPWDRAEALLVEKLAEVGKKGKAGRTVFFSELITGTLRELVSLWLAFHGSGDLILYEPLAYESLRRANHLVFGADDIPTYRIDRADFLISFGADFLETWLSPVAHARQFAAFRDPARGAKQAFIYVGPRLSMTAANADLGVRAAPGTEFLVALGVLRVIAEEDLPVDRGRMPGGALGAMVEAWPLEAVTARTGVAPETLRGIARAFVRAKRPLALAGGMSSAGPSGTWTAMAANILCTLVEGSREAVDFGSRSALGQVARAGEIRALAERMRAGEIDLALFYNANPVFSTPPAWGFREALDSVSLVVSFSSVMDETTENAHLILPTHSPLESWGDYSPAEGVTGLMQPVMGTMHDTRHLGDILLSTAKAMGGAERFPWEDFHQMLLDAWRRRGIRESPDLGFPAFWHGALRRGGVWRPPSGAAMSFGRRPPGVALPSPGSLPAEQAGYHLIAYPTVQFFDGRGANRPWLQELPDPMTQVTWGSWVEIPPEAARRLGIRKGDLVRLEYSDQTLELPAFPYHGLPADTLAVPVGQGHTTYGRFAEGKPGNPLGLVPGKIDETSGGLIWCISGVAIRKLAAARPLANTDGGYSQWSRGIAQAVSWEAYVRAKRAGRRPHIDLPLPAGYDPKEDFYPPHRHPDYRWAMVADLDRCIGCGACVVACYAENNVAVVGEELILEGREMSWLRIQRYFESEAPEVRFVPMLCQHCDNAPCEPVCPVYAPHHSVEGLNNQVYNRCIGTRFCSQNCPYKVRRFNWFAFTRDEPLNWQLNPDVTVRQKGVMEKCSFCVQRIVEAKNRARNEGRKVGDGEVTPACVQTCPTRALVFGNLKDAGSRVSSMIRDPRAYQVFDHLNTKPAVIYLKRLTGRTEIT